MGGHIPYMKLKFSCLNDLLKSIPDVASSYTDNLDGLLYVKVVPQEGSKHISDLVHGQKESVKKTPKAKTYNLSYANRLKTFQASNHFNWNNNNLRMSQKPQSFSKQDNCSHLVPKLPQPTQPTQKFPSATPSPTWKPRKYSPPPRFRSNLHTADNNNLVNKNEKVWSYLSNARYHIPAVSRVTEDRSHLKPQPMLPRSPTTVSPVPLI